MNASISSDSHLWWIRTSQIRTSVDKQTNVIRFYNSKGQLLTEEMPDGRAWSSATGDDHALGVSEVQYKLQAGEHLYGSGQFQDGFLNIARLPRRLVQLNTQIAVPFVLSNRGYGLLWHQYSMTDLNKPANDLKLQDEGGRSECIGGCHNERWNPNADPAVETVRRKL